MLPELVFCAVEVVDGSALFLFFVLSTLSMSSQHTLDRSDAFVVVVVVDVVAPSL